MTTFKLTYFIFFFLLVAFYGCGINKQKDKLPIIKQAKTFMSAPHIDTNILREAANENDIVANDYLVDKLKSIRANFKRINSIKNWTTITEKDLWETTEGGKATFYYLNKKLEKIITRHFGETFQTLTEYYLLNGQLSFVLEKSFKYNRPMYYETTAIKENNDTEAFDFDKSEIIEDRSYFANGKLIHQINNQDCGSPFSDDYLKQEQKRITSDFEKLINQPAKE